MSSPHDRSQSLAEELDWAAQVIDAAITGYFGPEGATKEVRNIAPPALPDLGSAYAALVRELGLGFEERFTLMLALAPTLRPHLLDPFLLRNAALDRPYSHFGGVQRDGAFLPTVQTAAFVLAQDDIEHRLDLLARFEPTATLRARGLIDVAPSEAGPANGALTIGPALHGRLFSSEGELQAIMTRLGVRPLDTPLSAADLVVDDSVMSELQQLMGWIQHSRMLLTDWKLASHITPGYRALFHGSPGTGKTLAAVLTGKATGLTVVRVDLSMIVSKYIGETERSLGAIFDEAERRSWILFFDEADALFGKRTATASIHDHYAAAEVAYLLQRIADFPGVVIVASCLGAKLDDAFTRCVQANVHFPLPNAEQRVRLWKNILPAERVASDVDIGELAEGAELSGGEIVDIVRFASLKALRDGRSQVTLADLRAGIARTTRG